MIRLIQLLIRERHLTITEINVPPTAILTGNVGGNPHWDRYPRVFWTMIIWNNYDTRNKQ